MRRFLTVFLLFALAGVASASPPYPFSGLLARAKTVFLGHVEFSDGGRLVIDVDTVLRGKPPEPVHLVYENGGGMLPKDAKKLVVISQGGDSHGKQTDHYSVGQEMDGQAGYCGWIVFPVTADGQVSGAYEFTPPPVEMRTVRENEVAPIVKRAKYNPSAP
jgi:hypothetical protein